MTSEPIASSAGGARGRPLGFARERLDEALMLAFWELGWNGASYPQLEKRTGVSRSSMGNTVGPKAALLAAAMECYLVVIEERLLTPMREGEKGVADVRTFFRRLREGKRTEPGQWGCLMAIAMTELGTEDPAVVRLTAEYRARLGGAFAAAVRRAHTHGELDEDLADVLTPTLVAAAIGLNTQARAGATDADLDALVHAVDGVLSRLAVATETEVRQ